MLIPFGLSAQVHGSLDLTFNPAGGASGDIYTMARQTDGKIVIGGTFTSYNGRPQNRLARVNTDGTLDTTFNIGTGPNDYVNAIAIQPDGKILVVGGFWNFNSTARAYIVRLNTDGTLDTGFMAGSGFASSNSVFAVEVQPDGKILIGGLFTYIGSTARNRIARLNANGTLDTSFNPGTGASSGIFDIALQPDGKILIGGGFTNYNGTARNRIARLNANGTLDTSFTPGNGVDNTLEDIEILPNGKILIGGIFSSFNSTARPGLAQLNANGTLDTGFSIGATSPITQVYSVVAQPDGKILISGLFSKIGNVTTLNIARLTSTGTLDSTFNPPPMTGANNVVFAMVLQPDEKIVIGGRFTAYGGTPISRMARLTNRFMNGIGEKKTPALVSLFPNPNQGQFYLHLPFPQATISITDLTGKTVFQTEITGTEKETPTPITLKTKGVFLLSVTTAQHTFVQKVVVE